MRIKYVKYIETTGEIRQWGECTEDNVVLSPGFVEGNLRVLKGEGTNASHYVCLADLILLEKPKQPSPSHVFDWVTKTWALDMDKAWETVRVERDRLLQSSDWRVTKAAELGQPIDLAWAVYRQALRNITLQADPLNIIWPTVPT